MILCNVAIQTRNFPLVDTWGSPPSEVRSEIELLHAKFVIIRILPVAWQATTLEP